MSPDAARCVLAATDPAVAAACEAAAEAATGFDIVGSVSQSRVLSGSVPACDVLLLADSPGAPGAGWAEQAARACPGVAIVLLAEDAGVETYRTALRIGACAVVPLPVSPANLDAAVAEALRARRSRPVTAEPVRGEVVAVAGACGGAGASVVSLVLAAGCGGLLVDLAGSRAGLTFALAASRDRSLGARPGRRGARRRDRNRCGRTFRDAVRSRAVRSRRSLRGRPGVGARACP